MDHLSREQLLDMSEQKTVGLIYSPCELHQYLVELIDEHKTKYLHQGKKIASFMTLDEAMRQAKKCGAKACYLCLDNTYDECGAEPTINTFNYLPIGHCNT